MSLQQIKDFVGVKVNGVSLNIDLINGCCLSCASCAVGSIGTKRKGMMTYDKFCQILDKAQSEFKVRHVQLYMYSDPCMHKDLHFFVQECTNRGIPSWISTMLQVTNCDFNRVIDARPAEFRISMPGFDNMSRFQGGADPKRFKQKFHSVCELPRHKETKWVLCWHSYKDNSHEEEAMRRLASANGLTFFKLPAIFMPLEKYVNGDYSEQDREIISHLWESPEEAAKTDVITCFEVLSHTYNHGILLDNIRAHLKQGGILYLTTPLVWGMISLPHGRGNYAEMTKDSVTTLLQMKGFTILRYEECNPWPLRFIFFGFLAPIRALMGKPKEEEGIAAVSTPMFSWWMGFKPVFKYAFNRFQLYELRKT